jgi:hypothetical protein
MRARDRKWPWYLRVARVFSFRVEVSRNEDVNQATGLTQDAEEFWHKYIYQGRGQARFWRVLVVTVFYFATGYGVMELLGGPTRPYRGLLLVTWDKPFVILAVFSMLFLIFFVVDATAFCFQLVAALGRDLPERNSEHVAEGKARARTRWPERTLERYVEELRLDKRYLDDWIAMEFVGRRTEAVARLVYYPFIVISLMVLSRSTLFYNWRTSTGLVVVISGSVLIVIVCAYLLRSGAEDLRRKGVERLEMARLRLLGPDEADRQVASKLAVMIEDMQAFRVGAFASYSQQPLVRALLLPLTTYGGAALAEYFSILNL